MSKPQPTKKNGDTSTKHTINCYHLYYALERELYLHQHGIRPHVKYTSPDEWTNYGDLARVFPPRPVRYENLQLSPIWFLKRKSKARTRHWKDQDAICLTGLTKAIANSWKNNCYPEVKWYVIAVAKIIKDRCKLIGSSRISSGARGSVVRLKPHDYLSSKNLFEPAMGEEDEQKTFDQKRIAKNGTVVRSDILNQLLINHQTAVQQNHQQQQQAKGADQNDAGLLLNQLLVNHQAAVQQNQNHQLAKGAVQVDNAGQLLNQLFVNHQNTAATPLISPYTAAQQQTIQFPTTHQFMNPPIFNCQAIPLLPAFTVGQQQQPVIQQLSPQQFPTTQFHNLPNDSNNTAMNMMLPTLNVIQNGNNVNNTGQQTNIMNTMHLMLPANIMNGNNKSTGQQTDMTNTLHLMLPTANSKNAINIKVQQTDMMMKEPAVHKPVEREYEKISIELADEMFNAHSAASSSGGDPSLKQCQGEVVPQSDTNSCDQHDVDSTTTAAEEREAEFLKKAWEALAPVYDLTTIQRTDDTNNSPAVDGSVEV
eukprot:scaffold15460_cov39-Cyclotella_meneghiniana.AAC.2